MKRTETIPKKIEVGEEMMISRIETVEPMYSMIPINSMNSMIPINSMNVIGMENEQVQQTYVMEQPMEMRDMQNETIIFGECCKVEQNGFCDGIKMEVKRSVSSSTISSLLSTKSKRSLDKEDLRIYHTTQKQNQKTSIILRSMVYLRILSANFGYVFVVGRRKRTARVGLHNYPISKIYRPTGELMFDIDFVNKEGLTRKIQYCQTLVIEEMIKLLEGYNYKFNKKYTKKSTDVLRGEYQPITLSNVLEFQWSCNDGKQYIFKLHDMEKTLGKEMYDSIEKQFENKSIDHVIVAGNEIISNNVLRLLKMNKPMSDNCVMIGGMTSQPIEMSYSMNVLGSIPQTNGFV